MTDHLEQTINLLRRAPATFDALLRDLPTEWTSTSEGGETWSAYDVVGHLVYGEQVDWVPRAKLILSGAETQPFEPFDRLGHVAIYRGTSLNSLLDDFGRLRSDNLDWLASQDLQPDDLKRRGTHPALGPVTLSQLLATWAVHDLTHIRQVVRVIAYQHRDTVGPWQQFLGILQKR